MDWIPACAGMTANFNLSDKAGTPSHLAVSHQCQNPTQTEQRDPACVICCHLAMQHAVLCAMIMFLKTMFF